MNREFPLTDSSLLRLPFIFCIFEIIRCPEGCYERELKKISLKLRIHSSHAPKNEYYMWRQAELYTREYTDCESECVFAQPMLIHAHTKT